ncbi:MAG: response regulator transcription factor [Planctomycetota bacterium]
MPNPKATILLVEDEPSLRLGLVDGLNSEGFEVVEAVDGEAALALLLPNAPFDAVLLDLMLPGIDGLEVLRRVRSQSISIPILILSARGEDADRILGFEYGADDFMVKPAPLREVVLRLGAVLRRREPISEALTSAKFGDIEIDFDAYSLTRDGQRFGLNRKERDLLAFFLHHVGEPIERSQLLTEVWGQRSPSSSRTVDTHIFRLRQKLEADSDHPVHLITVHGVGYRFETGL